MHDFLGGSTQESTCQCSRNGSDPWVGKIPWRRKWQATPVFLPGESHGHRSLEGYRPWGRKGFLGGSLVKNPPAMQKPQEMWDQSLGLEDPWRRACMATHSSILAWRIPWTEKPGGLWSTGSQSVRHNWVTTSHFISSSLWWLSGKESAGQWTRCRRYGFDPCFRKIP